MHYVLFVTGYLLGAGKPYYAFALLGLIAPQVFFQVKPYRGNRATQLYLITYYSFDFFTLM